MNVMTQIFSLSESYTPLDSRTVYKIQFDTTFVASGPVTRRNIARERLTVLTYNRLQIRERKLSVQVAKINTITLEVMRLTSCQQAHESPQRRTVAKQTVHVIRAIVQHARECIRSFR
jgi:hypothetical protein